MSNRSPWNFSSQISNVKISPRDCAKVLLAAFLALVVILSARAQKPQPPQPSPLDALAGKAAAALDKLPVDILSEEGVSKCHGAQLGAVYNAVGGLEYTPDKVVVGISLIRNENHKKIFDESA